jgi:hypothetical protein
MKNRVTRRLFKKMWLFFAKASQTRDARIKKPKKLIKDEARAIEIWESICHYTDTVLEYNPKIEECYAEWADDEHPVYVFLEARKLRIVNSIIGYDVELSPHSHQWCTQVFYRELHKRRSNKKAEALDRVVHSLDTLIKDINDFKAKKPI